MKNFLSILKIKTLRIMLTGLVGCLLFFTLAGCSNQDGLNPPPYPSEIVPPTSTLLVATSSAVNEKPDEQPPMAVLKQNGVTISLRWAYADSVRIAVEYMVSGVNTPAGYMLPCPVQSMSLSDNSGKTYDKYAYAHGDTESLVTRCQAESGQNDFLVTHNFYIQQPNNNKSLDLGMDVFIGGMRLVSDNGEYVTIPDYGKFHFDFKVSTDGNLTLNSVQNLIKDKLGVTLNLVEVNPSFTNVYMCIDYENHKGWYPETSLSYNGKKINAELASIFRTDLKNIDLSNWFNQFTSKRCFRFTFLTNYDGIHKVNAPVQMIVSLEKMTINILDAATQDDCASIRIKTQKAYPDLDFICQIDNRAGGYGVLINVTKTPIGMSTDDAQKIAENGFVNVVNGPWDFSFQVP